MKAIFCHIPKSAGTLFGQILQRNYGKRFYPYYGLWDNRFFTNEDVAGMFELHPQYDCLASHMFSLNLPFESQRYDLKAITFIRDPVQRALSHYFYSFRMSKLNPGYEPPKTVEIFFENILRSAECRRFCNGQFRFLTSNSSFDIDLRGIENLVRNGYLFLAPVERFADACMTLERTMPVGIKNAAYGSKRNVATRHEEVPDYIIQMLKERNKIDYDLHKLAHKCFDEIFSATFKNRIDVDEARMLFDKRCNIIRIREYFICKLRNLFS